MTLTIPVLTDVHLITCVVQRGKGDAVVKAAIEAGAEGATVHFARGTGLREKLGLWSVAVNAEKEVITIAVSREQLNFVFERIFISAKLSTPGMGFMYVVPIEKAATHIAPDILEKLSAGQS